MKVKDMEVFDKLTDSLKQRILDAYNVNENFFNESIDIKTIFVKTRREFNLELSKLGRKTPTESWVVGHSNGNRIIIFYPDYFNKVSDHKEEEFDFVLKHEIAHCFLFRYFIHKNI